MGMESNLWGRVYRQRDKVDLRKVRRMSAEASSSAVQGGDWLWRGRMEKPYLGYTR